MFNRVPYYLFFVFWSIDSLAMESAENNITLLCKEVSEKGDILYYYKNTKTWALKFCESQQCFYSQEGMLSGSTHEEYKSAETLFKWLECQYKEQYGNNNRKS